MRLKTMTADGGGDGLLVLRVGEIIGGSQRRAPAVVEKNACLPAVCARTSVVLDTGAGKLPDAGFRPRFRAVLM